MREFLNTSVTVYVMLVVPTGKRAGGENLLGEYTSMYALSSVMLGCSHVTNPVPLPGSVCTVCDMGHSNCGAVMSARTENENVQLALLPDVSVADATTVCVPIGNSPASSDTVDVRMPTLSENVGLVHCTNARVLGGTHDCVNDAGHTTVGASVSLTTTLKLHSAELPAPSSTMWRTVVLPRGNAAPLYRPAVGLVMTLVATMPMLSLAAMSGQTPLAVLLPGDVGKMKFFFDGHVMVGRTVSLPAPSLVTMAVNEHEAELPAESTALYVKNVRPRSH